MHGGGPEDEDAALRRVEEDVEFGRYTLKQKLAAGGMGVVYVAEDKKLKRTVALKMIRGSTFADEGEVARFTLEAEAAAGLDHAHIVPIYEVGRMDGQPFFTMKLIEGQTLAERLREHGGMLPAREVALLLSKLARAVHHAHQRGVLHRDLKPGNILLDAEGEPWLTDFGLAKLANADTSLTLTKDHIGTPHYMAPEVAGGNARAVSTASDVWAMGVMLWEMLCGMPPFHGAGPVEIMRRIVESEPNWPAGSRADGDLVTIARRCMEKNPARRPESAGEVAEELDRWLRGEPIKARPVTRGERFLKWVRREPAMAALYAVLVSALFIGLFLWNRAEHAVVSLSQTNQRMEESLQIATATKLAADARLQVEESPSRALLLAVESVEMTEGRGVLPESAAALTDVLQRVGGLDASARGLRSDYVEAWISANLAERESAQASPDGRWLMSVDLVNIDVEQPVAAVFDLHDRTQSRPLRRWDMELARKGPSGYPSWRWLDDSRHVVIVDAAGVVQFWKVITPEMEAGLVVQGPPPVQSPGTVAREGLTLYGTTLRAAGKGDAPVCSCWYYTKREDGQVESLVARFELTATEVHAGAVQTAGPASGKPGVSDTAADGSRAICFDREQDSVPLLVELDRSGAPSVALPGLSQPYEVVLSPDGKRAAVRCRDNSIWLSLLPAPGSPAADHAWHRVVAQPGSIDAIVFSPDGKWLALTGDAGTVTLAPLTADGRPVTLPLGGRGLALQFSANSRWLAAGGTRRTVRLWLMDDIEANRTPLELRGCPTHVTGVSFASDDRSVIATSNGWTARRWPFDSVSGNAQPQHFQAGTFNVYDLALSPDHEWIASACGGAVIGGEQVAEGCVTLSRLNQRGYHVLGRHANRAWSVAFSKSGRWLASTGQDNTVQVWDFPALKAALLADPAAKTPPRFVLPVEGRPRYRYSLAFHPGDGCLYQVNGDGVIYAWDLSLPDPDAMRQEERIHSQGYLLPDVTVSPDGRWLAVARHAWDHQSPDSPQHGNQVLLYDVSVYSWRPKFVMALQAYFLEETNLAFSSDSRWLASGGTGQGAAVWDLRAPDIAATRKVAPVTAQTMPAVGFSPDNRYLAMGANDGQLYFWNWQDSRDLRSTQTGAAIHTMAWLPDGRLATAGGTSKIALWDTDLTRLKAMARRVAGRELSTTERERFRVNGAE